MGLVLPPQACATSEHIGCGVASTAARYGGIRYDNYGGAGAALGSIVDCFVVGFNNGSPGGAGASSRSSSNGASRHELHGHRSAAALPASLASR